MIGVEALPRQFLGRVVEDPESGCWLWTGATITAGYGHVRYEGGWIYTHRLAYIALVDEIPDGWTIDHLCRVRACCNPSHLEPVTRAENLRRAAAMVVACPRAHPYDAENTYVDPGGGRRCRACARESDQRRRRPAKRTAAA